MDIDINISVKWISESQKKSYSLLKVAFLQNICARLALSKRGGRALPARPAHRRRHRALAYVALLVWPLGLRYAQRRAPPPVRRVHGPHHNRQAGAAFPALLSHAPDPFPPVLVHTVPALAFKAAKPDMAQKIVSGLHFRSRSLYGPGLGVEYC